jgi:hypothetical protein
MMPRPTNPIFDVIGASIHCRRKEGQSKRYGC